MNPLTIWNLYRLGRRIYGKLRDADDRRMVLGLMKRGLSDNDTLSNQEWEQVGKTLGIIK